MGGFKQLFSFVLLSLITIPSQSATRACLPIFSVQTVHAYTAKQSEYNPFSYYLNEVIRIEALMPESYHTLAPKNEPHRYDSVVYKLAEIRKQQHQQIQELHNEFKRKYPKHALNQAFENTLKSIEFYEYDLMNFLNSKTTKKAANNEHYEYSKKQKNSHGHIEYEFRPYLNRKLTFLSRSTRGYITELVTSLHMPKVVGQGIHVEKLLSKHMISVLLKNGVTKEELEKFQSFEIDVVFNNGHSWGEVKNYAFTFRENMPFRTNNKNKRQGHPAEKLLFKAELISKMLKILNQNNYNIQMHFFFYNNGVSQAYKEQLKQLDIIVE